MRKLWVLILITAASAGAYLSAHEGSSEDRLPTQPVLILYDAPEGDDSAKLGYTFALMLRNLLGHFELDADIRPTASYVAGQLESYTTTFYLGSHYDHPIPEAFLKDVVTTDKRVVWFKYNLWQMAWNPSLHFEQRYGLRFMDLVGLNAPPTPSHPRPGFFDTILYKGKSMVKYYEYDPKTGVVSADPDMGVVQIVSSERAKARVWVRNSGTQSEIPYVVQAGEKGNFWYFADLPFTFIGPRDRYLAFCDLLHDILGINHPEEHRAMVRLEDVSAKVQYSSMKRLVDFMDSRRIPFSVAVIPEYRDPLGAGNDGRPEKILFSQATELQRSLQYATRHGGSIVMHGYTHQYASQRNPNTGISADDFEFWDTTRNAPVVEDSEKWALGRLDAGLSQLRKFNIVPFAWEVPHYQASPVDYKVMAQRFPVGYQRVVYYSSLIPDLNQASPDRDFAAGMFFPYVIAKDVYGQRILPENLGNIEYDISDVDPTSNFNYTWQDLLTNAEYAMVVRDGFGSFFFHPFWLDPDFEKLHAFDDFRNLIDGITRLGYQWVQASQLTRSDAQVPEQPRNGNGPVPSSTAPWAPNR